MPSYVKITNIGLSDDWLSPKEVWMVLTWSSPALLEPVVVMVLDHNEEASRSRLTVTLHSWTSRRTRGLRLFVCRRPPSVPAAFSGRRLSDVPRPAGTAARRLEPHSYGLLPDGGTASHLRSARRKTGTRSAFGKPCSPDSGLLSADSPCRCGSPRTLW